MMDWFWVFVIGSFILPKPFDDICFGVALCLVFIK